MTFILRERRALLALCRRGCNLNAGVDAYPDLITKAAALLQLLARNHASVNGNKRTAWAAAWTFLSINGVELDQDFDVDGAENFMNAVATQGDLELAEVAEKVRSYAAALPRP